MSDCFYALADEEQLGMGRLVLVRVEMKYSLGMFGNLEIREKLFNQIVAFISRTNDLHYLRHYRIVLSGHLTLLLP